MVIAAEQVTKDLAIGDSVAVNGACLTAVEIQVDSFSVDLVPETLRVTQFGTIRAGDLVNLERSLAVGSRLGGHFVQGHVDACGQIKNRREHGNTLLLEVAAPPEVMRYVIPKGSIAVDGVSLTIMQRFENSFVISLIPHTAAVTTLGFKRPGDPVHLEADMLGKYVQQFLQPYI